jgi:hypothetical protein
MTTSWEMQMAKQRDAEKKVKDAEKLKKDEEERKQAEEDGKFGNKVKKSFGNAGQGIKNVFHKTDQKISQSVDGKHKSNGGVSPRDQAPSTKETEKSPRK